MGGAVGSVRLSRLGFNAQQVSVSPDTTCRRIVVPTDFSACAEQAWVLAQRLARPLRSELLLIHVVAGDDAWAEAARRWATDELGDCAGKARVEGLKVRVALRAGVPYREIVAFARDERADLIVIGIHGHGRINRLLLGSVADRLLRVAPCPVLTVRESA